MMYMHNRNQGGATFLFNIIVTLLTTATNGFQTKFIAYYVRMYVKSNFFVKYSSTLKCCIFHTNKHEAYMANQIYQPFLQTF